ncbi:hypothetical protein BWQ96_08702 [Gracilariopsis chorda]|uniref:Uncharacterized protein n=1 Tax=Gracilariopsis chorda TaxID=448386 RepID=A0A2V3IHS4_9FLOR|nr:hypothetical protein BWQ96_08702 [Gracilariopsis chorda]|eukprot:PXF41588.1 hypothetical protein BWQ96_08702 [Gracilariopsis chorda]
MIVSDEDGCERAEKALCRRTGEWDMDDQRFYAQLRKERRIPGNVKDPRREVGPSVAINAFMLVWRRGMDVNQRIWSTEMCRPTRIVGRVEISVPCVQISGDEMCDELVKLLEDGYLENAVM